MSTIVLCSNTSWYLWNFRKNTILALLEMGYSVVCLAPRDEYSAKLTDLGVQFIDVPLEGKSIGLYKEVMSMLAIFNSIRRHKPVFVFNFTIKMNLYSGISCRLLGIEYANNVSGLGTVFLHASPVFLLARRLYGFANTAAQRTFFQNHEDLATFVKMGFVDEVRSKLLPGSGIDVDRYAHSPWSFVDGVNFLMISRLIGDKGVREYVEAAQRLAEQGINARCTLIGPGGVSNKTAITDDEIATWKANGVVNYVGEQKDVIPWIQKTHVLVLPSYREGMPRTVLEAASIGRPAIVTDVPGCRQSIVENQTGWLCKVRDADDLARVMAMVAAKPPSELEQAGRKARERIEKEFAESIVIEHYLDCLKIE